MLQVFASQPLRVFEGHKSDVVDFSWSHSDFLCSASIDHTVMLWHPVRWVCCCAKCGLREKGSGAPVCVMTVVNLAVPGM